MTGITDEMMRAAMIEQACAWQARHLSGELTPAEKVEFLKWLQDNPRNVREYLVNAQITKLIPQALQGLNVEAQEGFEDPGNVVALNVPFVRKISETDKRNRWLHTRIPRLAAAAVIACAAVYWGVQHLESRDAFEVTVPHGEQRTIRLDDGSVIHLNSQSHAQVRYSKRERLIELDQGQALFSVARDATRPFRVRAGSTEVLAVGTQFDVYRRSTGDVTVTVVEGKVAVVDRGAAHHEAPESTPSLSIKPLRLDAGQQIRVGVTLATPTVEAVDTNTATAWVRREIVFRGRPLGEVADEFNRYLSVPVYIEDAALKQTRVSGIFSAYDEEAFLAFLREFGGVEVEVSPQAIRVRGHEETD